jgi:hypothetical protein
MKKLLVVLLFVPIVSFGQMDYYVSAKGGLNVREAPEAKAKKVSTLSYGTFVSIESRTAIKLTINDTDKRTGVNTQIEGEWVEIVSENNIAGYVFDGYLVPFKPNPWTIFTTVSGASLNLKNTDLNTPEIKISYTISTMFYKNLKVGEIVQLVPLEKDLPNLEFRVTSVEKVKYEDSDLAPDCCDEYNVEAKIIKNITDKYLGLNKEEIYGLVIHPPVKDAKFIDIPNVRKDINYMLDFDNDGNPDFQSVDYCLKTVELADGKIYCDLYGGGTEIKINNKWIELTFWEPM